MLLFVNWTLSSLYLKKKICLFLLIHNSIMFNWFFVMSTLTISHQFTSMSSLWEFIERTIYLNPDSESEIDTF